MFECILLLAGTLSCLRATPAPLAPPGAMVAVERNVVYGMYSGLALLMDVYSPSTANGRGILLIGGSGWHSHRGYRAGQKKAGALVEQSAIALTDAGFTVFAINHREAPRFHWPAARDDAQRAVRWIRHHADRYGIAPQAIGVMGGSSGAHLAALLGTIEGNGDPDSPDPVERESPRVQGVALFAPATDLEAFGYEPRVVAMMGHTVVAGDGHDAYVEASPIRHVSPDDPPFFILHGQNDQVVPVEQSVSMAEALREAGVDVELTILPEGDHNNWGGPEATIRWLAEKLVGPEWAEGLASLEEARRLLEAAESSALAGDVRSAVKGYERAQETDSRLTVQAESWNTLCRSGAVHDRAAMVVEACDRAVSLQPENGWYRDSRGLVRVLVGDIDGAIADFEALVAWESFGIQGRPRVGDAMRELRLEWIHTLRSGGNPFTPATLARLRDGGG